MARISSHQLLALHILCLVSLAVRYVRSDGQFTIINNCATTVWIGAQSSAGISPLSLSNVMLSTGQSLTVATPAKWGGRFWGRTGCTFGSDNTGSCVTGDCGGRLQCDGAGGKTPATLVEVTLDGADGKDFYDVSLVDGYNLPVAMAPKDGGDGRNANDTKSCNAAGCTGDLNQNCPADLRVMSDQGVVGCKSACEAFGGSQYCCTGPNANPNTCPPTDISKTFKQSCPKAYSYAYDDISSLFTCRGGQYTITFCPTALSDGVQFPEAQPVPTNQPDVGSDGTVGPPNVGSDGTTGPPNVGSDGTIGTNFRIITNSRGELVAPVSFWLTFFIAVLQLRSLQL